ncbi:MAG: histone deacetylase family protein, partial [Marinospirillum sp.]|nr:histone deacetylase family protein [Marinospirillum sp.]
LDAHTGSFDFRKAIEKSWLPALQKFRPQLLLISAGFDAHREDPMGELNLEDDDYHWITNLLMDVSKTYCNGHLVSVLEGGYDLNSLARSVHRHIEALQGV